MAPGLYKKETRFVIPFMAATMALFLGGASFGYFFVFPGALKVLIIGFGSKFNPIVTIEEYTGFFLSMILSLGISFEMPILIFFLAMFGIVSPKFLWKNVRYAVHSVFVIAAFICPSPDPWTMCIYALPMLSLYIVGIGVAWWVHPTRRKAKVAKAMVHVCAGDAFSVSQVSESRPWGILGSEDAKARLGFRIIQLFLMLGLGVSPAFAQPHFNGPTTLDYAREFVAVGPRWPNSQGHVKARGYLEPTSSTELRLGACGWNAERHKAETRPTFT